MPRQAAERLDEGHAGRDEGREDDRVVGPALCAFAAQQKRGADGYGGERIAGVVDQVGEGGRPPTRSRPR
jgi:hypothetical protein